MKVLLLLLTFISIFFFVRGISNEENEIPSPTKSLIFINSTKFNDTIYFTFPWYHHRGDYRNIKMISLLYDFDLSNEQSSIFVVVTPFINWNRLCIKNCSLNIDISRMRSELWGIYIKSIGTSFLNYTIILEYTFETSGTSGSSDVHKRNLVDLWIFIGLILSAVILFIGIVITVTCINRRRRNKNLERAGENQGSAETGIEAGK